MRKVILVVVLIFSACGQKEIQPKVPKTTTWNNTIKNEILEAIASKNLNLPLKVYTFKKIKNLTADDEDDINMSKFRDEISDALSSSNITLKTISNGVVEGYIFDFYENYERKYNNLYVLVLKFIDTRTGIYKTYLFYSKYKYEFERI